MHGDRFRPTYGCAGLICALWIVAALAARGESPAAFDRRCIPSDGVAPRSNTPGILPRLALPGGRLAGLGATRDFHHGLLDGRGQDVQETLPNAEAFLREARERLRFDPDVLDGHTYLETRTDADVSFFGGVKTKEPKIFRVFRSRELGIHYKRLITVDGKPLPDEELEAQDRKRGRERIAAARRRARETEQDRAKRAKEREEADKKEREMIDEVLGIFDYRITGRDMVDGESAIVVSFTPRPGVKPKTRQGKIMAKTEGRAWVHEADRQVIRVEAEAVQDVTIGFGLIARLHTGSSIVVTRTLVGETWMPAGFEFSGTGRTLLFRTFDVDVSADYSEFEKLTADMLPFPVETALDQTDGDTESGR